MTDPEYGFGFEKLLYSRKSDFYGILNGVDYSNWNPSTDSYIPQNYDIDSLQKKTQNKKALCNENNLEFNPEVPLIGIISRLVDQKGFDLIADAAEDLLSMDLQLIILGTGDPKYHRLLEKLKKKYSKNLAIILRYDNKLAHLIEAGSDIFLMPSKYEPCGLNQMFSLKYGTVPVVRETGGLADSIKKYDAATGEGTGFVFTDYTKEDLLKAVSEAIEIFANKNIWHKIQVKGMKEDFSWNKAANKYIDLYQTALNK
jgi:starch synthase